MTSAIGTAQLSDNSVTKAALTGRYASIGIHAVAAALLFTGPSNAATKRIATGSGTAAKKIRTAPPRARH